MECIDPDTVPSEILDKFNCSNVKPSGNWNGDWQQYVNDNGDGAGGAASGGSAGGFGWQQYVNGGGKKGEQPEQYDWQQWVQPPQEDASSSASRGEAELRLERGASKIIVPPSPSYMRD